MMEFPGTRSDEDEISYNESFRIYGELRKKYQESSVKNFDIILNSLCFALVRLFALNTDKKDARHCADLVKQIILKNLED